MPRIDISAIAQPQGASMSTLGSMMDNMNKVQSYRMNQLTLQQKEQTLSADIAKAQAESARAGAEANVSQQTQQPRIEQAGSAASTAATGATSAKFKLQGEQANVMLNEAGVLSSDPVMQKDDPEGQINALRAATQRAIDKGVPAWQAELQVSHLVPLVQKPGALYQALQNITRGTAGPQTQAGVINSPLTAVTEPSGGVGMYQMQPGAAGAPSPATLPQAGAPRTGVIPPGVPPVNQQKTIADALGRPAIEVTAQDGSKSYQAPQGAPYKPMMTLPAGENVGTVPEVMKMRTDANNLAAAVPQQQYNIDAVRRLAPEAFTGTVSKELAWAANLFGGKFNSDVGASSSQLQHFIASSIVGDADAQGANTDLARRTIAQAVLPSDSPQKAIDNIMKVKEGMLTGYKSYSEGMNAAIVNSPKDIFAARDFRNAWSKSFDPRIAMIENAKKAGDTETIDRILGPANSDKRIALTRELRSKTLTLQRLSQGQL